MFGLSFDFTIMNVMECNECNECNYYIHINNNYTVSAQS